MDVTCLKTCVKKVQKVPELAANGDERKIHESPVEKTLAEVIETVTICNNNLLIQLFAFLRNILYRTVILRCRCKSFLYFHKNHADLASPKN